MKNIIITGTSRGIGKELCILFAKQNFNVLAISRNANADLTAYENITQLSVDLADENELHKVQQIIESKFSNRVDYLINNAGAIVNKPFATITNAEFEYVYKVNVFGVAALIKLCLPYFEAGSHVVTISSMGGIQGSMKFPGLAAYSSAKGAVITLSELLAEEYKEHKISFNVLALGAVQTEMLNEAFPGYQAPISPLGMAEYIADFTQNGNKYFNGKVLQVSSTTP
ncbi:SDR family oxidoreductase [Flavobacterium agricola]|uniref:SDR family oxidoreductase n=1 Tax=Flavobacterium agricola TaxID=2870839 RepID=A0ABY6LYS3_9FLAO|nr:SDR family oxidoreductase [Flavobacterium agricola]UYW01477.1 SDR family oxidoreductase [Flavobacterium agricola]